MLIISKSLWGNHSCISKSLLITIRQRVLIHRTKRKRALKLTLNRTVWRRKESLTVRKLILRLILTLTRKVRIKTAILTVSIFFKLRALIITLTVILLITYAVFMTFIMLVHVSLSVFLELKSQDKLINCHSISREINKSL